MTLRSKIQRLCLGYLPVALLAFIGAEYLVSWVGGEEVAGGAAVLRVFLVYVILLPADRLIGVAIDSTGKPMFNSMKVWIMVALNVVGDILVLYNFQSLPLVALVTVVNIVAGVAVGGYLLKRPLGSLKTYLGFKTKKDVSIA